MRVFHSNTFLKKPPLFSQCVNRISFHLPSLECATPPYLQGDGEIHVSILIVHRPEVNSLLWGSEEVSAENIQATAHFVPSCRALSNLGSLTPPFDSAPGCSKPKPSRIARSHCSGYWDTARSSPKSPWYSRVTHLQMGEGVQPSQSPPRPAARSLELPPAT